MPVAFLFLVFGGKSKSVIRGECLPVKQIVEILLI